MKFAIVLWGKVPNDFPQLKIFSFDSLIQEGWNYRNEVSIPFASVSDLATLIYTSGTTGRPKGVELTHENLLYQITSIDIGKYCPVPGNVFVSILPCWHVFERTAEYYFFSRGVCVVYSNVRNLRNDLQLHKPHFLVAVPRVFESLYNNIMSNISKQSRLRRQLIQIFSYISLTYHRAYRNLFSLDIFRIDSSFVKKVKSFFVFISLFIFHRLANWMVYLLFLYFLSNFTSFLGLVQDKKCIRRQIKVWNLWRWLFTFLFGRILFLRRNMSTGRLWTDRNQSSSVT